MAFLQILRKKELSDEELISKYKESSNTQWVGELYQRYTHISFAVCLKYLKNEDDAKDAVMQVFEKLMADLLKHEVQFFQAWFHTYLRNHCLMQLRKSKSIISFNDEINMGKNETELVEMEDGTHLSDKEILELNLESLELAILQLKNEQQQCVRLFFLEEKTYKEIEEQTGFDYKQVKSFIQNGKRNLKIIMDKNA